MLVSFGLPFAIVMRNRNRAKIMGDKLAPVLYLIIVAIVTLLYIDNNNVGHIKHAVTGQAVAQVQAEIE